MIRGTEYLNLMYKEGVLCVQLLLLFLIDLFRRGFAHMCNRNVAKSFIVILLGPLA
jgi:hypothetical protein